MSDSPEARLHLEVTEAARMLRAALEVLPPRTTLDRATVRRIEGAALALDGLAELNASTS